MIEKKYYFKYDSPNEEVSIAHSMSLGINKIPLHNHAQYEVLFLLSESATFYIEGRNYPLLRGDVVIFNGRELHKIDFDLTKPYERVVFSIKKEYALPFCTDEYNLLAAFENRQLGQRNVISAELAGRENLLGYFGEIKRIYEQGGVESDTLIKCQVIQMMVAINRLVKETAKNEEKMDTNDKIPMILKFINDNLFGELSLDMLSEKFFISKYYMSHIFKHATGFSLHQYIAYKRIAYAEKLISDGVSASDACIQSGFNDYSNFYRTYVKVLGHPPKNLKK